MKHLLIIFVSLFLSSLYAQKIDLEVRLEPLELEGFGGIQSFAYASWEGKWLIVGGRLDGLHMKQPWASFHPDGNNTQLMVIDPESKKVWTASLATLTPTIRDQLSSTNMEFYQDGGTLYLVGGYAYSAYFDKYLTFPFLTAIDVSGVINGIIQQKSIGKYIRQIQNEKMAVTGGGLEKIGSTYYLVGGQNFQGRYNPHGPNHGPGFSQEYTHEIRTFQIVDDGSKLEIARYQAQHDELHLRRRDYNLVPQIIEGKEELMVFSGVFRPTADLPWLYPISIKKSGYEAMENETQVYNHYHCAHLPIYFSDRKEMHTLFFGGIAQYYSEGDTIVQDDEVPFVNTIAGIVRTPEKPWVERKLKMEMPHYLGASGEFIPAREIPLYKNGTVRGSYLLREEVLAGYLVGGIRSNAPNIFWINDGSQSTASATIFKVYISAKVTDDNLKTGIVNHAPLSFYPRPDGTFNIKVNSNQLPSQIDIFGPAKNLFASFKGENIDTFLSHQAGSNLQSGTYLLEIYYDDEKFLQKVIVE